MFCLKQINTLRRAALSGMTTKYIQTSYEDPKKEVNGSPDCRDVCLENFDLNAEWFVGSIQLVFDKTATKLKSSALVAP